MRHSTWLMALILSACVGEKITDADNDPDTQDTDEDEPDCIEDIECGAWEICIDDGLCAVGDRNNGQEEATPITQGQILEEVIAPAGDVDWFVYTSTGDEWVRINTKTNVDNCSETATETIDPELGVDTVVTIRNAVNGATHAWMDNFPTGRITTYDTVLNAYLPTAGDWYITVEDVSTFYTDVPDRGDTEFHYCVEVTDAIASTSEADTPLNPSLTVDMTSPNSIWSGGVVIGDPEDVDFFRLTVNDPGPIEIYGHSELPGSDAIPQITVSGPTGDVLSVKRDVGPDGRLAYFHAEPGNYTVAATDALGSGGPSYWYPLYFRTRALGFWGEHELEPNDTRETGNLVTILDATTNNGTPYRVVPFNGTLEAEDDEDWVTVPMSVGETTFSLVCSADAYGSQVDLAAEIYDAAGTLLVTQLTGSDAAPDLYNQAITSGEDVHVRLYAEDGFTGPSAYYYCVAWLTSFEVSEP